MVEIEPKYENKSTISSSAPLQILQLLKWCFVISTLSETRLLGLYPQARRQVFLTFSYGSSPGHIGRGGGGHNLQWLWCSSFLVSVNFRILLVSLFLISSTPSCDHFGRHGEWKKVLATKMLVKVANWRPKEKLEKLSIIGRI